MNETGANGLMFMHRRVILRTSVLRKNAFIPKNSKKEQRDGSFEDIVEVECWSCISIQ